MDGIDSDDELLHLLEGDPVLNNITSAPLSSRDVVFDPPKTPVEPIPEMLRCMNISSSLAQPSDPPLSIGSSPSISRSSRIFRPSSTTRPPSAKRYSADIPVLDQDPKITVPKPTYASVNPIKSSMAASRSRPRASASQTRPDSTITGFSQVDYSSEGSEPSQRALLKQQTPQTRAESGYDAVSDRGYDVVSDRPRQSNGDSGQHTNIDGLDDRINGTDVGIDDLEESASSDYSATSRHSQYSRASRKSHNSQMSHNSQEQLHSENHIPASQVEKPSQIGFSGYSGYSGYVSRIPASSRSSNRSGHFETANDTGIINDSIDFDNSAILDGGDAQNTSGKSSNTKIPSKIPQKSNIPTRMSSALSAETQINDGLANESRKSTIDGSTNVPKSTPQAIPSKNDSISAKNKVPVRALTMETLMMLDEINDEKEKAKVKEQERMEREKSRLERERRELERQREEEKLGIQDSGLVPGTNSGVGVEIAQKKPTTFDHIGPSGIDLSEIAGIREICGIPIPLGPETARICALEEREMLKIEAMNEKLQSLLKKSQANPQSSNKEVAKSISQPKTRDSQPRNQKFSEKTSRRVSTPSMIPAPSRPSGVSSPLPENQIRKSTIQIPDASPKTPTMTDIGYTIANIVMQPSALANQTDSNGDTNPERKKSSGGKEDFRNNDGNSGYALAHAFGKGHGYGFEFNNVESRSSKSGGYAGGYGDNYRSKSRQNRREKENPQISRKNENSRAHSRPASTVIGTMTRPASTISDASILSANEPSSIIPPNNSNSSFQNNDINVGRIGYANSGKGPRPHSAILGRSPPGKISSGKTSPIGFSGYQGASSRPASTLSTVSRPDGNIPIPGTHLTQQFSGFPLPNQPNSHNQQTLSRGGSYAAAHSSQRPSTASNDGNERSQARLKAKKKVLDSRSGVQMVKMSANDGVGGAARSDNVYTPTE